jgi:hypothetical protein
MTDDHHGRTRKKETLQVRAADEVLGTHRGTEPTANGKFAWAEIR